MQIMENLLHMALWASMILLVVLAIRPIIKNKSNRIMCVLWLLVMFRFLCPVAVKVPMPWLNMAAKNVADTILVDTIQEELSQENGYNTQIAKGDLSTEGIESSIQTMPESAIQNNRIDTAASAEFVETVESTNTAESMNRNDMMNLSDQIEPADQSNRMAQTDQVARMGKLEPEDQLNRDQLKQDQANQVQMNQVGSENLTKRISHPIVVEPLKIFGVNWLLGTVIILTAGIRKYLLIKRALREAIYISEWENYPVKISDVSGVPLAFGIWKREIYVPVSFEEAKDGADDTFTRRQKELILWHETMHLKRLDPLRKVLAFVMVAVHWWNPLVWICVKLMDRDIEMACDEAVLERIGQNERKEYARTLLSFAEKQSGLTLITSFGESAAKSRIRNALTYRKSSDLIKAVTMLPVLILGGCLALNPTASAIDGQEKIEDNIEGIGVNIEGIENNIEDKEEAQINNAVTDNRTSDSVQNEENDYKSVPGYIKTSGTDLSYAPEYLKIIDSYLEKYPEEIFQCGLIYFNDDEIPDLAIESADADGTYRFGLYMYEDGKAYTLLEEENPYLYFGYDYSFYDKKGMLLKCSDIDDGFSDGRMETYWLLNPNKKFDCVLIKMKYLDELRDDPNYTWEQIYEAEKKNGEWEYNGEIINTEEAEKLLKTRLGCDDYDVMSTDVCQYKEDGLKKIKKDLTRLMAEDNNIYDTKALENSLYEKFKQGKEKVYFEQNVVEDTWLAGSDGGNVEWVPSDQGYTISELMDVLQERYFSPEKWGYDICVPDDFLKAQFAYLDCGHDGVPELAMQIRNVSLVGVGDDSSLFLMIKEKDGKLQCTYATETGSRWRMAVNEAGVYAGVSEGGCYQLGEIGMFDANAEYHKILSCDKEYERSSWMFDDYYGEDEFCVNQCTIKIDGTDYTYYVEADTGEDMYSSMVKVDPSCMRREEVVKLEDIALEKSGCTKECLEADDILFFVGDIQEVIDLFRNEEVYDPIRSSE